MKPLLRRLFTYPLNSNRMDPLCWQTSHPTRRAETYAWATVTLLKPA